VTLGGSGAIAVGSDLQPMSGNAKIATSTRHSKSADENRNRIACSAFHVAIDYDRDILNALDKRLALALPVLSTPLRKARNSANARLVPPSSLYLTGTMNEISREAAPRKFYAQIIPT
jgi:hypothetical protein